MKVICQTRETILLEHDDMEYSIYKGATSSIMGNDLPVGSYIDHLGRVHLIYRKSVVYDMAIVAIEKFNG